MNLVDEKNARYKFGNALLDIFVNDPVDLITQLVCYFRSATLDELAYYTHDILTTLRLSICHVEIMQSNVLYNLFSFLYISFW